MDNNTYPIQQQRPLSVDGLQPQTATARPGYTPAVAPHPQTRRVYFKPKPAPRQHRLLQKLQLPLLLLAGALGGFFADNLVLGLGLLAAYGAYAFLARVTSRTTFTLALLLLVAISLLLLFKPNLQLIRNFSSYAFVLLLIGVITLGREAKMPKRMRRKYRR